MTKSDNIWVEVLWLRPHKRYGYFPGDLGAIQRKDLPELLGGKTETEEVVQPYVKVITPEEKKEILESRKPAPPSDEALVCVRFLKPHPQYAYNRGQIGKIFLSAAKVLFEDDFIQLLTEEEYEEILNRKPAVAPISDFVKVTFLRCHGDFAYSAGDTGLVAKGKLQKLLDGGYVELYQEVPDNVSAWDRFTKKLKK